MPKPICYAYTVRNFKKSDGSEGSEWTRIGALFPQKDGQGFDCILNALPINGRVVFRKPLEKNQQGEPGQPIEPEEIPY